ncbi:MAG: NAD(P)/FAD-dependent oxidoreductase [Solirubrobacterales bacterium]|nr:NAD(P)/FAD-dependent oxidoreductase [Solirubrobacterales bacterium]
MYRGDAPTDTQADGHTGADAQAEVPAHADSSKPTDVEIAIVGAGFSGLGMAMALKDDGFEDFVVLERADDLGGTWRDNTYPGCACDIPSVLYSWSDAQNPRWSRAFAGQQEIWGYMREEVQRRGVAEQIRYGAEALEARWDEDSSTWEIETTQGRVHASVLISGAGALADPSIPNLPGLEQFSGKVFHSARWDHGHDLRDREVAVIGTGASSIQFVPEIQPHVRKLHLFQRTPPWVMPRANPPIPRSWRRRFERHPWLLNLVRRMVFSLLESFHVAFTHPRLMALTERRARRHIASQVPDPAMRARLTPDYRLGCKRILGSDDWYPAICSENVEVVDDGIAEITADGIRDGAGVEHHVDTIIFGTGFQVSDPPIAHRVRGPDGRSLAEVWEGSPKAHLGLAVSGFPNLFLLLGPNTGLGHNSVLLMIEAQVRYLMQLLRYRRDTGSATLTPRAAAQERFIEEVAEGTNGSVWTAGGCLSWYVDNTGRNSTLWPGSVRAYQRRLARFKPSEYEVATPRRAPERQPVSV